MNPPWCAAGHSSGALGNEDYSWPGRNAHLEPVLSCIPSLLSSAAGPSSGAPYPKDDELEIWGREKEKKIEKN